MTIALCINCGEIKFGAFCLCDKCQVSSSGNQDLDIQFSDHCLAIDTLEEFGSVIKMIQTLCDDANTRYWIFIYYVSKHHPTILKVDLKPDMEARVTELLGDVVLPSVMLRR